MKTIDCIVLHVTLCMLFYLAPVQEVTKKTVKKVIKKTKRIERQMEQETEGKFHRFKHKAFTQVISCLFISFVHFLTLILAKFYHNHRISSFHIIRLTTFFAFEVLPNSFFNCVWNF